MARKSLNDVIHGDRATVRANHYAGSGKSVLDDWDAWDAAKAKGKGKSKYDDYSYGGSSKGGHYVACYKSHPPLKLPGTELLVYGGSCSTPVVTDADVYIGFDSSMSFTARSWPWKKGHEFLFKITDMSVPTKPEEFAKLVAWAKTQIDEGKKLHAGCIGGHGRTGTFLSALVSLYGEKDAITYVRKHYCKRAVESSEQIKFLGEHFGITPAEATKSLSSSGGSWLSKSGGKSGAKGKSAKSEGERFAALPGNGCIWA